MDRVLCHERFDGDPESLEGPLAEHVYFLDSSESFQLGEPRTLVNFVLPNFYDYIRGCATYQLPIDILMNLYTKPKNKVFVRHISYVQTTDQ